VLIGSTIALRLGTVELRNDNVIALGNYDN